MYGNLYFQDEENQRRGWPLWKTDESYLRYYNITPTFILEVKLCVSTSVTHNVSPSLPCIFSLFSLFFFSARTLFHFLCLALALTRTFLLSCHACSSLFIASSPKSGSPNGPTLAESSFSGFSSFLRTSVLASRDQTPFVVGSETRETAALLSAK